MFLMMIFSMNSIMGFACSTGLNLGYNSHHHAKTQEPSHTTVSEELYASGNTDHCGSAEPAIVPGDDASSNNSNDCCRDGVLKFTLLDKNVSSSIKIDAPAQFAIDIAAMYFLAAWNAQHVSTAHYYVQSDHPPISTDIRIAIQSFQI